MRSRLIRMACWKWARVIVEPSINSWSLVTLPDFALRHAPWQQCKLRVWSASLCTTALSILCFLLVCVNCFSHGLVNRIEHPTFGLSSLQNPGYFRESPRSTTQLPPSLVFHVVGSYISHMSWKSCVHVCGRSYVYVEWRGVSYKVESARSFHHDSNGSLHPVEFTSQISATPPALRYDMRCVAGPWCWNQRNVVVLFIEPDPGGESLVVRLILRSIFSWPFRRMGTTLSCRHHVNKKLAFGEKLTVVLVQHIGLLLQRERGLNRNTFDTWKCGGLSFTFCTHPPKKKRSELDGLSTETNLFFWRLILTRDASKLIVFLGRIEINLRSSIHTTQVLSLQADQHQPTAGSLVPSDRVLLLYSRSVCT